MNVDKLPVQFSVPNFVSRYQGGYVMEPGIDCAELVYFIVPKGKPYIVRAEITHYDDSPDDEADRSYASGLNNAISCLKIFYKSCLLAV